MKPNGFKPSYLIMLVVFLLLAGIYVSSKFANENTKISLTNLAENKLRKASPKLGEILNKNQVALVENSASNLLTRERNFTQDEIDKMNEEQFSELLTDIERRLPVKADIKALPTGALHHTPPMIVEAGRNLGLIREILKVHPTYEKIAQPFYEKCAGSNDGTTPVRALCLTNLILVKEKNNEKVNTKNYPDEIVKLSKIVTE